MVKNVVLDFGHGGIDSDGKYTTAPSKMFKFEDGVVAYEGKINREIGKKVYDNFRAECNLNVVCTVEASDSTDLSLYNRVKKANSYPYKETVFVSIHCNAGKGTGYEIFTSIGQTSSDKLAEEITNAVKPFYKKHKLPIRTDMRDGDQDKESNFYVLKKTKGTAVLIECGFFDNRSDFDLLSKDCFQAGLAKLIYKGIMNYIGNENKNK